MRHGAHRHAAVGGGAAQAQDRGALSDAVGDVPLPAVLAEVVLAGGCAHVLRLEFLKADATVHLQTRSREWTTAITAAVPKNSLQSVLG